MHFDNKMLGLLPLSIPTMSWHTLNTRMIDLWLLLKNYNNVGENGVGQGYREHGRGNSWAHGTLSWKNKKLRKKRTTVLRSQKGCLLPIWSLRQEGRAFFALIAFFQLQLKMCTKSPSQWNCVMEKKTRKRKRKITPLFLKAWAIFKICDES